MVDHRRPCPTRLRAIVVFGLLSLLVMPASVARGQVANRGVVPASRAIVPAQRSQDDANAPQMLPDAPANPGLAQPLGLDINQLTSPAGATSSLKIMALLTILSLAPSILMMTTCFIRFVVVFGLLRQALGTQQLPPNQVIVSLALFLTVMVMGPIWTRCYDEGIRPYSQPAAGELRIDETAAIARALAPLRQFMAEQIDQANNGEAVWMFVDFQRPPEDSPQFSTWKEPETYDDIHFSILAPAYMLSELKVAFLIGFQIYLPFIVIDMVISSVLISMGMMMLPPVLVSLPFKLLLFVLIDGWFLTVGMLLESVRPLSG